MTPRRASRTAPRHPAGPRTVEAAGRPGALPAARRAGSGRRTSSVLPALPRPGAGRGRGRGGRRAAAAAPRTTRSRTRRGPPRHAASPNHLGPERLLAEVMAAAAARGRRPHRAAGGAGRGRLAGPVRAGRHGAGGPAARGGLGRAGAGGAPHRSRRSGCPRWSATSGPRGVAPPAVAPYLVAPGQFLDRARDGRPHAGPGAWSPTCSATTRTSPRRSPGGTATVAHRLGAVAAVASADAAADQGGRDRGDALAAAGEAEAVGGGRARPSPGRPAAADSAASASARRGPIRGRLPITCTATLPISKPAARTRRAASASRATPAGAGPLAARRCRSCCPGRRGRRRRTARRSRRARRRRRRSARRGPAARRGSAARRRCMGTPSASACTSVPMPVRGGGLTRRSCRSRTVAAQPIRSGRGARTWRCDRRPRAAGSPRRRRRRAGRGRGEPGRDEPAQRARHPGAGGGRGGHRARRPGRSPRR